MEFKATESGKSLGRKFIEQASYDVGLAVHTLVRTR